MSKYVALLRGINVGGHNKVPMAALREVCSSLGFAQVQSYIQSGNLIFTSPLSASKVETILETAILTHFAVQTSVLVRTASAWRAAMTKNPFIDACASTPNLVMLCLTKRPPNPNAAQLLQSRASSGEMIEMTDDLIWVRYCDGVANSKLSPSYFDRAVGSPVTARNWNTVVKVAALL